MEQSPRDTAVDRESCATQQLPLPSPLSEVNTRAERLMVLVVDDTPAIREMLSWILQLQGYEPVCMTNGQEALAWIEKRLHTEQYPAAIILDLFMPVMDGSAFLAHLRSSWHAPHPIPPVLLLTVATGNQNLPACSDVLIKPFHIKDLSERLRRLTGLSPSIAGKR